MTQYKISFAVSKEVHDQIEGLPRAFNLSERLRMALVDILYEHNHKTVSIKEVT